MLPLIKDEGGGHVVGQEADLHLGGDELHRDVIGYPVDGDGGVPVHLPGDAVEEAFLQPLSGLRDADGGTGLLVALHGRGADAGMNRGIIGTHIVPEEPARLLQGAISFGGDGVQTVQRVLLRSLSSLAEPFPLSYMAFCGFPWSGGEDRKGCRNDPSRDGFGNDACP